MNIKLEDCQLISASEYLKLEQPEFIGQTRLSKDNTYYMVWRSNGKLYKTFNTLGAQS